MILMWHRQMLIFRFALIPGQFKRVQVSGGLANVSHLIAHHFLVVRYKLS